MEERNRKQTKKFPTKLGECVNCSKHATRVEKADFSNNTRGEEGGRFQEIKLVRLRESPSKTKNGTKEIRKHTHRQTVCQGQFQQEDINGTGGNGESGS